MAHSWIPEAPASHFDPGSRAPVPHDVAGGSPFSCPVDDESKRPCAMAAWTGHRHFDAHAPHLGRLLLPRDIEVPSARLRVWSSAVHAVAPLRLTHSSRSAMREGRASDTPAPNTGALGALRCWGPAGWRGHGARARRRTPHLYECG